MEKVVLNIGLNVGSTESYGQLNSTLLLITKLHGLLLEDLKIVEGTWMGNKERTLVASLMCVKIDRPFLIDCLNSVCKTLEQDAIATKLIYSDESTESFLVFQNGFSVDLFNPDFFIAV